MKQLLARFKPYLRWLIFGATLFFIASTLHGHWDQVKTLRLTETGGVWLLAALGITLLAHLWTGWVWSWILQTLGYAVSGFWAIETYLTTNVAKYLPGNVWHFYGRIVAAKQVGVPAPVATLSVLLEALLMAAAALMLALINADRNWAVQLLCLVGVLVAIHPRVLNPLLNLAGRLKGKATEGEPKSQFQIQQYPVRPLLGELGFVTLRGIGFLCTIPALYAALAPAQLPAALAAFSIAWVLGLVVPGAPGGIGVFEATALALLRNQLPVGVILGVVALYRVISILAEVIGAGLAYGWSQRTRS